MTVAGLLLLYAAFAGGLTLTAPAQLVRKQPRKPQMKPGWRFIDPEALDERKTTR